MVDAEKLAFAYLLPLSATADPGRDEFADQHDLFDQNGPVTQAGD